VCAVQVVSTGDENTPAMVARSGPNSAPLNHNRASLHSNALVTHPITDILDGTLWNRDLGSASEDIVGTLVEQLFNGIRDYIVQVPIPFWYSSLLIAIISLLLCIMLGFSHACMMWMHGDSRRGRIGWNFEWLQVACGVQAAEMKFNCFFLMPVIDVFPMKLREELEVAYDADLDAVFDIQAVRHFTPFIVSC
jgi:hypothetical protein